LIRFVFWDIDNTIFDFDWAEANGLREAYESLGAPMDETMFREYQVYNRGLWDSLERGEISRDYLFRERHRYMVERFQLPCDPDKLETVYRENLSNRYRFMPHAVEILRELHGKYALYIASNGVIQTQYRRLKDAGIWNLFDGIYVSEAVGAEKPDIRFFQIAASQISGFKPEQSVIIGDSLGSDIAGGKAFGMKTILYNHANKLLSATILPDYVVNDLREIPKLLDIMDEA